MNILFIGGILHGKKHTIDDIYIKRNYTAYGSIYKYGTLKIDKDIIIEVMYLDKTFEVDIENIKYLDIGELVIKPIRPELEIKVSFVEIE